MGRGEVQALAGNHWLVCINAAPRTELAIHDLLFTYPTRLLILFFTSHDRNQQSKIPLNHLSAHI